MVRAEPNHQGFSGYATSAHPAVPRGRHIPVWVYTMGNGQLLANVNEGEGVGFEGDDDSEGEGVAAHQ